MLSKLAFRNVKRSIKDYFIYLITVTMAFSVLFSFNLISFSKEILGLTTKMISFQYMTIFVSVIVVFVIGWLINYTMKFMLQKRSKEMGTYLLLGIEKKKITRMFLIENIILGLLSLLFAFGVGLLLSQLFTMIIMKIFELPFAVNFDISPNSFLLTILYFAIIYLFVLFSSRRKLKKMKLYDLLYFEKVNEKKLYRSKKIRNLIFIISVVIGALGLYLFCDSFKMMVDNTGNPMVIIVASLIMIIASIYGVTITCMDFLTNFMVKRKRILYRNQNLFVFRQITSKVRTMGMTIGTLSLLVALTLLCLNISNIFSGMFKNITEAEVPYDIMVYNTYTKENEEHIKKYELEDYLNYIKNEYAIEDKITYYVYTLEQSFIRQQISNGRTGYQDVDCYIRESDYNKLLKMRGMHEISLKDDEYYIHSYRDVSTEIEKSLESNPVISLSDRKLHAKGMSDFEYSTSWSRGSSYIVVVPDEVINEFKIHEQYTAINTVKRTNEAFFEKIKLTFPPLINYEKMPDGSTKTFSYNQLSIRETFLNENRSMMTTLAFCFLYIAFIFTMVVGTILSIQSLSDSTKYKYRYTTLKKLGMEDRLIYKTLNKQLLLLYLLPLIYPIIINIVTAYALNIGFNPFLTSNYSIMLYFITNLLIFLLIYGIYYIITYFGFKKNIQEN